MKDKPVRQWRHNCCSIQWFQDEGSKSVHLRMKDITGIRDHFPACRAMALLTWNLFKEHAPPLGERGPVTQKVFDALTIMDLEDCPITDRQRVLGVAATVGIALQACLSEGDCSPQALLRMSQKICKDCQLDYQPEELCWAIGRNPSQILRIIQQLPAPLVIQRERKPAPIKERARYKDKRLIVVVVAVKHGMVYYYEEISPTSQKMLKLEEFRKQFPEEVPAA